MISEGNAMRKKKVTRRLGNKVLSSVMALVLAAGLLPVLPATSFAEEQASGQEAPQDASVETVTEQDSGEALDSYATDHILVIFDDGTTGTYSTSELADQAVAEAKYTLEEKGYAITETLSEAKENVGSIASVDIPQGTSVESAVEEAKDIQGVAYAQPDYIYYTEEGESTDAASSDATYSTEALTNDPATQVADSSAAANQYYLYGVETITGDDDDKSTTIKGAHVLDAWDLVKTNQQVTVAVLDTGCNLLHEDLQDNILKDLAYDAYHESKLEASGSFNGDYAGHGSHVCGIVGATANNGIGIAGASYNAKVLPVKVFTDESSNPGAYTSDIITGYEYLFGLIDDGTLTDLHVINMSLGSYSASMSSDDKSMQAEIQEGVTRNILTVCAGGNGDDNNNPVTTPHYPSDFDESFAVTALNADGTNATWSDYNTYKDISAPGVAIYSTINTDSSAYKKYSGTSMASPLVAGIAALLWAADPDATVAEVREAIQNSADPIVDPEDTYQRWPEKTGSAGSINAAAAIKELNGAFISVPDGFSTLKRTQQVQLSASIRQVSDNLDWTWSVEDDTGSATISSDGLLTGVTAGTVKVTAKTHYNDEDYEAFLTIQITDIALPAAPECSRWYSSSVKVTWTEAEAAVSYKVQRKGANDTEFTTLATLDASEAVEGTFTYEDYSAVTSERYTYRIVPQGKLKGEVVDGESSNEVSGLRFDMTSVYASQASIATDYVSHLSVNNVVPDTVVLVSEEDEISLLSASGLAGLYDASMLTIAKGATTLDSDLQEALTTLNPLRIVVVGNTENVSEEALNAISTLLPHATVARYSSSAANTLAESLYSVGSKVGTWGSTAFIISPDAQQAEEIMALCSYAYRLNAPVFVTKDNGTLSVTARQNLRAGAFERIVIVGSEDAVSSNVETQLLNYGMNCERISANDAYEMSIALANDGVKNGTYTGVGFGFTQAHTQTCAQAAALASSVGIPLLVVSADNLDAVKNFVGQSTQERIISIFDGSNSAYAFSNTAKTHLTYLVDVENGPYTLGDINNNGTLNIVDVQICYDLATKVYATDKGDYAAFMMPHGWNEALLLAVADVNFDGTLDATDALAIEYSLYHKTVR